LSLLGKGRRGQRLGLVLAGSLFAFQALALVGASPAFAANCTFTGGTLTINTTGGENVTVALAGDGDTIVAAACAGGTGGAKLSSPTNAIVINGDTGNQLFTIDMTNGDFGTVKFTITGGGGNDSLEVDGASDLLAGASGIDLNDDGVLDVTLASVPSGTGTFTVTAADGGAFVAAYGGGVTGAAIAQAVSITGGSGDDVIGGGAGNDTLSGGSAGSDTVDYSGFAAAVTVDLGAGTATGGGGSDTLASFSNIIGTPAGDTLTGKAGANDIVGGAGDDKIDGAAGEDTADYSDSAAAVTVDLGAGTATGDGTDTLSNIEDVFGSDFNDTISGDDGPNVLDGAAGNDTLAGMGGGDDLVGNDGTDTVDYSWSDPVDLTLNGCGSATGTEATNGDTIETMENAILSTGDDSFVGNQFGNKVWPNGGQNSLEGDCATTGATGGDTLNYSMGYDAGVTVNMAGGGTAGDSAVGFENVVGTAFADNITGGADSNTIKAGKGNDNVKGGAGDDTLRLGAGNDIARGGSGDDDLFGGKGADYLNGGSGTDLCKGGPGKDTVKACEIH
jgi:hemolysin type calcium-binding protein